MVRTSLFMSAALLLATACDGPTRVRTTGAVSNAASSEGTTSSSNGGTTAGYVGGTTSGTSNGQLPAGFESCNTNPSHYHPGIGYMSVCQSSQNELSFRLSFTTTDQSDGTCIVPLYKDSSGNSAYVGHAKCTKHNENQVVFGTVVKDRAGYTGHPVNGVMVVKYSGTTAFFQCMNAYGLNNQACLSSCAPYQGNAQAYQACAYTCDSNAKTYMANVCANFKANTPYIDIRTR